MLLVLGFRFFFCSLTFGLLTYLEHYPQKYSGKNLVLNYIKISSTYSFQRLSDLYGGKGIFCLSIFDVSFGKVCFQTMLLVTEFGLGNVRILSGLMYVSRLFCGDSYDIRLQNCQNCYTNHRQSNQKTSPRDEIRE